MLQNSIWCKQKGLLEKEMTALLLILTNIILLYNISVD